MAACKRTLDIHHTNQLEKLASSKAELESIRSKIASIEAKISVIEAKRNDGQLSYAELSAQIGMVDARLDLIDKLNAQSLCLDECNYFINTSDILFKYYDLVEKGDGNLLLADNDAYSSGNSILRFFTQTKKEPPPPATRHPPSKSRGSLLDNYMAVVNSDYINAKIKDNEEKCSHCGSTNITVLMNDGYTFCNVCHTMAYMIVDHDKPSYKDPPKEITYFSYKRINHLNEWLNQIQGKETTEIPEEIYDKILLEIKKQRITNMAELTYDKVKQILKQLKVHKYYEHIPHIIHRLNGLPMPNFSQELEEKLRTMFKQIQTPFLKHSPPKRKNFLSYSYVLHKFLQLLEKDDYLVFFQLLKSRDKLALQDKIWQKICEEVQWQFIPSL